MNSKSLQIIGPFFTNYSLARVNRGLALALDKVQEDYKITLSCEKDQIDWWPTQIDLKKNPKIKKLFNPNNEYTDIAIYNNFPKSISNSLNLKNLPAKIKLMYTAWEETVYPKSWVDEINKNLHGVMTASSYTKNILQNNGVSIPIKVILNAMDDGMKVVPINKYSLKTSKKFKFLHISTGKVRKGVDLLINSYFKTFKKNEDVTLIIKSFPGPDNNIDSLINSLKNNNSPEVIHINKSDLTDQELTNLISSVDCGVFPSRAEGFGLPILECMYNNIPVIATNYSGYLDFINQESGYLINYTLENAQDSEFVNIGAKWAEPDINELSQEMRKIYELKNNNDNQNENEEFYRKIKLAKTLADKISWENSAFETIKFINKVSNLPKLKQKNLAVITVINSESGIAEYSKLLYQKITNSFNNLFFLSNKDINDRTIKDESNVIRTWSVGELDFADTIEWIKQNNINMCHIQYHSGFFNIKGLDILIEKLKQNNISTIITMHSIKGNNFNYVNESKNLYMADKIIILNKDDYELARLKLSNIELATLGNLEFIKRDKSYLKQNLNINELYPIVATHGLMNNNKGLIEIIEAIFLLKKIYPNILLLALSAISSNNIFAESLYKQLIQKIKNMNLEKNVCFITEFIDEEYIEIFLQSSDICIFAYSDAGESASAAVRKGMNSLNPTIVTSIKQFEEFNTEVYKIHDNNPDNTFKAILKLLENKNLNDSIVNNSKEFIQKNSYDNKALELLNIYAILD